MIRYQSAVLMTIQFDLMRDFYEQALGQTIRDDFGTCVSYECGLSIWQPAEGHPAVRVLEPDANGALELCFETDTFDADAAHLKMIGVTLAHGIIEENWGQRTMRFFDPDGNLVELGESMPALCIRLHKAGMDAHAVAKKTGILPEKVQRYLELTP